MRLPPELVSEIATEIERAAGLHGEQEHLHDAVWLTIATEEVGEIAEGILEEGFGAHGRDRDTQREKELHTDEEIVQTISVLVHWLQIRRRTRGGR